MLMPFVSVTVIGVAIAVVGIIRGRPAMGTLLQGLVGAWVGFLIGAVPGAVLDVILGDGVYLGLLGHLGATAGAVVAVARGAAATRPPAGRRG